MKVLIIQILNDDIKSFQNVVDTIYNACKQYGSTPSSSTPNAISNAIGNIYTNRYNSGRTQGQNDVKNNPNSYGLYNKTQYDQNYNNGYNAGYSTGYENGAYSNTVLIGGGFGNSNGFNFSKSGLTFSKCILVYAFSAYYMRGESAGWGIISATGITLSLIAKQWFDSWRNTGIAMFIYNGTNVQSTINITAKAEDDGTTSAMVVYCIY